MVHKGFKTLTKTPIKTKHLSIMNLTFYLVFFILLTSFCFTSALKCYRCEEKNSDFCSRLDNKNSWEIVECSGSCFSGALHTNLDIRTMLVIPIFLKSFLNWDSFLFQTQETLEKLLIKQNFIKWATETIQMSKCFRLNCYCFSLKNYFVIIGI